ncbi:MEG10-like protein, partial [Mya arenaria]
MYACAVLLILVRVVCAQDCSTCKDREDGHDRKCSNTGKCYFGCIDGYYGNNCLHNCTYQSCISCYQNTGHYCLKCKSGYYLYYTHCHPCNSKCKSCDSLQRCLSCYDGHWGSTCQNKCSSECKNGHCDEESSSCRCSPNYKGETCDQCANGWFGQTCQYECSRDCKNGYCDKESAVCRCSPNYKGETCDQCSNGRFGKTCQYWCSRACKNGHCDEESGFCRCSPNFKGETCDQCSNGQFGEKCEHNCSLGCEFGNCTRDTGFCPCKSEWSGQRCKTKTETNVEQHTQSIAALLGGVCGGVVIFVGIVVIGHFLLRRRRANFSEKKSKLTEREPENFFALYATVIESEDRDDISPREITVENEDIYCNNAKEVGKFKLTVADLPEYVQYICLKDLEEEFQ